ncbi:MAG: hypothetical protein JXR75_00270 [Rhodobacteraceae bacterium]|nr:hypothetical protein [Paracoccaceae bacterium]
MTEISVIDGIFRQGRISSARTSDNDRSAVLLPTGASVSTARFNNYRCSRYEQVYRTISDMASLPEGHPLSIRPELAKFAVSVVGVLENNSDASPPKVYPEDDDGLVLKWTDERTERLLALVGHEVELSTEDVQTCQIRSVDFGRDWASSFAEMLKELHADFSASSESKSSHAG